MSKRQTIIRVQHGRDNPYFMVRRDTAQDARLTFEARGVLFYLLSKPDHWEVSVTDLMREGRCGRDRIKRIIIELEALGYLKRAQIQGDDGKFGCNEYTIYERPQPLTEKPSTDKPSTENPLHREYREEESTDSKESSSPTSGDESAVVEPTKPPRKRSAKQQELDAMIEALASALGFQRESITASMWSELRGAGKELITAHATPADIPDLHAWCSQQGWTSWGARAMSKHWPKFLKTRQPVTVAATYGAQSTTATYEQMLEVA